MSDRKDMLYKCIECNDEEVTNDYRTDGRVCTKCGGHLIATGYVIGIDLASGKDMQGWLNKREKETTDKRHTYEFVLNSISDRVSALYLLGYKDEEINTLVNDILFQFRIDKSCIGKDYFNLE